MMTVRVTKRENGDLSVQVRHNRLYALPAAGGVFKDKEALKAFVTEEAKRNESIRHQQGSLKPIEV